MWTRKPLPVFQWGGVGGLGLVIGGPASLIISIEGEPLKRYSCLHHWRPHKDIPMLYTLIYKFSGSRVRVSHRESGVLEGTDAEICVACWFIKQFFFIWMVNAWIIVTATISKLNANSKTNQLRIPSADGEGYGWVGAWVLTKKLLKRLDQELIFDLCKTIFPI